LFSEVVIDIDDDTDTDKDMATKEQQQPVDQLFKELDEYIQQSQYKKAIRLCNKILVANKTDVEAFQCKVICLMFNGSFQEAIDCLKSAASPATQSEPMLYEKSYCLYSLTKYNEALQEIATIKQKPNKFLELEAQIYYKLENYQKTVSIYESLLKEPGYNENAELLTNLCAAYIDAGKVQECQDLLNKHKNLLAKTYEFAFNAACLSLYKRDVKSAETQLKLAKKVCVETLKKDGFSEEDIQQESSSLNVQLAYCQQLIGNVEEAREAYQSVLDLEIGDSASLVAKNNIATLKQASGATDYMASHEHIKSLINEKTENKLTSRQKQKVLYNQYIVSLNLKKVTQCEELLKTLKTKYNDADINQEIEIALSTQLAKDKKWREAEDLLKIPNLFLLRQQQNKSLKSQLALAQLYLLENNNIEKALAVLKSLDTATQAKPGIIATMVALYEKAGDLEQASSSLDTLIASLEAKKNKTEKEEDSYISLLKVNGNFKMKHLKYKEAASCYEKVLKVNANDLVALPSYIVAASHYDPTVAQKYEGKLPAMKYNDKIDVDLIEKLGLEYEKSLKPVEQPAPTPAVVDNKKKDTKKPAPVAPVVVKPKIPKRLPKNYDPNVKPDPERWLPKWQRSGHRSKKGFKGKKVDQLARGSQGVSSSQQASTLAADGVTKVIEQRAQAPPAAKPRNINKKKTNK
ncbi:hypothetical protein SAMD00019534_107990, partial [Acytostelium subglobosum LB1]|uniref:hypothetical protein n=1 Tax=Acytostelium subglobosum LB1 TaxID=1410327 RepID=UPI0006447B7D